MLPPGRGARRLAAAVRQAARRPRAWRAGTSRARRSRPCPPAPTRFMPSFQSPPPISGRPWPPTRETAVERPRAVLEQRARARSETMGWKYESCSPARRAGPSRKGTHLVEHREIAGDLDVVGGGVRQPDAVVGDPRAHPLARRRQPPVLHVALDELPRGGAQQMLARRRPASTPRAPSRPGAGRGSRRRRSPGRTPSAPRPGRRASGRGASGSAGCPWSGRASSPAPRRGRRPSGRSPRARPRRGRRCGSARSSARASAAVAASPRKKTISARSFGPQLEPGLQRAARDRGRRRLDSRAARRPSSAAG